MYCSLIPHKAKQDNRGMSSVEQTLDQRYCHMLVMQ